MLLKVLPIRSTCVPDVLYNKHYNSPKHVPGVRGLIPKLSASYHFHPIGEDFQGTFSHKGLIKTHKNRYKVLTVRLSVSIAYGSIYMQDA